MHLTNPLMFTQGNIVKPLSHPAFIEAARAILSCMEDDDRITEMAEFTQGQSIPDGFFSYLLVLVCTLSTSTLPIYSFWFFSPKLLHAFHIRPSGKLLSRPQLSAVNYQGLHYTAARNIVKKYINDPIFIRTCDELFENIQVNTPGSVTLDDLCPISC
jgi:hypothetical protein